MTATIRRPEPGRARPARSHKSRIRFSFMESLGFIESPAVVTRGWVPSETTPRFAPAHIKRGAHERTVADIEPLDTTRELFRRNVRWGLVATVSLLLGGALGVAGWLLQRPSELAEAAANSLRASASSLAHELEALEEVNATLTDPQVDSSAINAAALTVDSGSRELFTATAELPESDAGLRARAADAASKAIDAARLVSDAAAYRGAVIQILAAPRLETDPELIALDEAIRQIGAWRMSFDQVRSALPSGTMTNVSTQLDELSANLESIQSRYVDSLREDDRHSAEAVVLELAAQLQIIETVLNGSLEETQEAVSGLIEESLAGIDDLLG